MLDLSKFFFGEQMPVVAPPATDSVMADYDAMMNYTNQMMAGGGGAGVGAPGGFLGSLAQMGGQRSFLQPEAPAVSAASGFAMGPQMYQQEMARQQERNIQATQLRAEEDKQRQHHQFLSEVEKGRQRMETQKMLVDMKDRKDQFALKRDEFKLKQEEHQLAQEMKQFELDQMIANKDAPKMQVMSDGRVALMFNDGTVQYAGADEALSFARDLEGIKQDSYLKQLQAKSVGGGGAVATPESSGEYGVGVDGMTAIQGFTNSRNKMINDLLMKATGAGAVPDMEEVMAVVDQIYPLTALQTMPRAERELEYGKKYLRTDAGFVPLIDGMTFGPDTEVIEYSGLGNLKAVPFGDAPEAGVATPVEGESAPAGTEVAPTAKYVRDAASGKTGTIDNGRFKPFKREKNFVATQGTTGMGMYGLPGRLDINDPEVRYDRHKHVFHKGDKTILPAEGLITGKEYRTSDGETMYDVDGEIITKAELDARNEKIKDRHTPLRQQGAKYPGQTWDEEAGRWFTKEDLENIKKLRGKQ